MNRAEEAATFYLRARDVAKNTTDYNLLCLINSHLGTLYLHRDLCTQTTEAYKLAHDYSLLLGDSATISYSFSYLGRASIICGNMEKAVEYYKEAIDIAEQCRSQRAFDFGLCRNSNGIYQNGGVGFVFVLSGKIARYS